MMEIDQAVWLMSKLTFRDGRPLLTKWTSGSPQILLLWDGIINRNWPLYELRAIVVIIAHKFCCSGERECAEVRVDLRDFIWLDLSYLINSWIQLNLARVATTSRGIEQEPGARPEIFPWLADRQEARPIRGQWGRANQAPVWGVKRRKYLDKKCKSKKGFAR